MRLSWRYFPQSPRDQDQFLEGSSVSFYNKTVERAQHFISISPVMTHHQQISVLGDLGECSYIPLPLINHGTTEMAQPLHKGSDSSEVNPHLSHKTVSGLAPAKCWATFLDSAGAEQSEPKDRFGPGCVLVPHYTLRKQITITASQWLQTFKIHTKTGIISCSSLPGSPLIYQSTDMMLFKWREPLPQLVSKRS